jgi:predicted RNA binding protein YcfA (HicA-like mRNA interferase family)
VLPAVRLRKEACRDADAARPGRSGVSNVSAFHRASGPRAFEVLVNAGNFEWRRTAGDHAQLYYVHPTNEDDCRQVTVPLHDELRIGTLRDVAEDAGALDFEAFCEWIDANA